MLSPSRKVPRAVGIVLLVAATLSWIGCFGGYAAQGSRSEVLRVLLPYALALSAATASVMFTSQRVPKGGGSS